MSNQRQAKTARIATARAMGALAAQEVTRPDAQGTLEAINAALEAKRIARNEEFATCKMSRMLEMALEDLVAIETDPGYGIDMGVWHERGQERPSVCYVCLAGSVMAKSLDLSKDEGFQHGRHRWGNDVANRLKALNSLRKGCVTTAFLHMGTLAPEGIKDSMPSRDPVYLSKDKSIFRGDMQAIIAELKKHGQ